MCVFYASLVAQSVKNLPEEKEISVQSLGREDLLEKKMANHSSILNWKNPMDRGAWWLQSMGLQRVKLMLCLCSVVSDSS